ncbi:hypothetical protein GGTG_04175 [Gaeumannomyces tritici R3-111a-1]|uniref:Uncharacterized protein n=1 Tax=Gaeumannomyces tritici (strain R3-111a-1) TaxID=644352 RepID=J3NSC9_GAET3|nr:hypothetical protein GGTG_04175 [Gaeumannomyces tritici R3-111a-1]EJT79086.1 hypothetical protein GGTG_04175 [Gaeumannomyces tritici R3-111a-1]
MRLGSHASQLEQPVIVTTLKWPQDQYKVYAVTFDHLIPPDDDDPQTVCPIIYELEEKGPESDVAHVNERVLFPVGPVDYVRKRVLAVPRCCQTHTGADDDYRISGCVQIRDGNPTREVFVLSKELPPFLESPSFPETVSRLGGISVLALMGGGDGAAET